MTKPKDSRVKLWTSWTDADVETLKTLWRKKNSASEIAEALTRQTGRYFTRNAIIGKINRLGLQGHGQLASRLMKSKKRKPREKKPPAIAVLDAPVRFTPPAVEVVSLDLEFPPAVEIGEAREEVMQELASEAQAMFPEMYIYDVAENVDLPISGRVTLFHLAPGVCRWPVGDPLAADFTFCGDACDVTRAYCETHHKIAYVPITKQKQPAWRAHR